MLLTCTPLGMQLWISLIFWSQDPAIESETNLIVKRLDSLFYKESNPKIWFKVWLFLQGD